MHALTLALFLLTPIASATATNPVLLARSEVFDPNTTPFACIFLTSDTNWSGETQNLCQVAGVCSPQLPDGLSGNVSSVGPTEGQTCFLYSGANCTGTRSAPIVSPGYADLSAIGFDKQAVSWVCWKMCGYEIESSSTTTMSNFTSATSSSSIASISTTHTSSSTPSPRALHELAATTFQRVASITTTLSGSQPVVNTTTQASSISTTSGTTGTAPSGVRSISTTLASNSTSSASATAAADTPGFSMSPSPVTLTHTFADGSTTDVIEPVPTVPSAPPKA